MQNLALFWDRLQCSLSLMHTTSVNAMQLDSQFQMAGLLNESCMKVKAKAQARMTLWRLLMLYAKLLDHIKSNLQLLLQHPYLRLVAAAICVQFLPKR
jgi:hypothetical protein